MHHKSFHSSPATAEWQLLSKTNEGMQEKHTKDEIGQITKEDEACVQQVASDHSSTCKLTNPQSIFPVVVYRFSTKGSQSNLGAARRLGICS